MGCTPRMIKAFCEKLGVGCHGFWEDRTVLHYVPPHRDHSIAFSFSNGHFNLFDAEATFALAQRDLSHSTQLMRFDPLDQERESKRTQTSNADMTWWSG